MNIVPIQQVTVQPTAEEFRARDGDFVPIDGFDLQPYMEARAASRSSFANTLTHLRGRRPEKVARREALLWQADALQKVCALFGLTPAEAGLRSGSTLLVDKTQVVADQLDTAQRAIEVLVTHKSRAYFQTDAAQTLQAQIHINRRTERDGDAGQYYEVYVDLTAVTSASRAPELLFSTPVYGARRLPDWKWCITKPNWDANTSQSAPACYDRLGEGHFVPQHRWVAARIVAYLSGESLGAPSTPWQIELAKKIGTIAERRVAIELVMPGNEPWAPLSRLYTQFTALYGMDVACSHGFETQMAYAYRPGMPRAGYTLGLYRTPNKQLEIRAGTGSADLVNIVYDDHERVNDLGISMTGRVTIWLAAIEDEGAATRPIVTLDWDDQRVAVWYVDGAAAKFLGEHDVATREHTAFGVDRDCPVIMRRDLEPWDFWQRREQRKSDLAIFFAGYVKQ